MENKLNIVALLPMKAHSSRVPGKNFRELSGKPLFRWILDTLLAVDEISKVVINTDARSILNDNGLEESDRIVIRDRKQELCGDEVSMNLVLEDDDSSNVPVEEVDGSEETQESADQEDGEGTTEGSADSLEQEDGEELPEKTGSEDEETSDR